MNHRRREAATSHSVGVTRAVDLAARMDNMAQNAPGRRSGLVRRKVIRFLERPVSIRNAIGVIVTATVVTTLVGGVLVRVLDRRDFSNIGDALWWSLQTVTTVG